uniref:Putative secreted protein n=1 Tax=Ixodes ricinus TaxID=34613 RepID=A0A6B0UL05_IXORI
MVVGRGILGGAERLAFLSPILAFDASLVEAQSMWSTVKQTETHLNEHQLVPFMHWYSGPKRQPWEHISHGRTTCLTPYPIHKTALHNVEHCTLNTQPTRITRLPFLCWHSAAEL